MTQILTSSNTPDRHPGFPVHRKRPALSRRQKAAIIVRLLLQEGTKLSLEDLPEAMQMDLTHEMGTMRLIDKSTLESVVQEFISELSDLGMAFPGGIEGALDMLDGAISPSCVRQIRQKVGVPVRGDPWKAIAGLPIPSIVEVIRSESTEVAAVILSKLPVARSAELLGLLPGEKARAITYAVSQTTSVDPDTVHAIGMAIAGQLTAETPSAFEEKPVDRVGAILNSSQAQTRDDVLIGLDEADADFAGQVRKAIFTFENIATRVEPRDVPKLARAVDQGVLVTALAGALGNNEVSANFILENMSKRLAAQLREDMQDAGAPKPKDAEEAMGTVVAAIRDMETAGELTLISDDEDD